MKFQKPLNTLRGLTLIEVLVVIAIIGILAAVISVNAVESGKISRDAKRQADLRMLQSAVELYKNKEGRYPEACNGADSWSGQLGTDYECADDSTQYIIALAPKYIPVLPQDPKINGVTSGYVYRTNADGTVYKIMAMRTVESESVDYYHEFKSCDIIPAPGGGHYGAPGAYDIDIAGWCRVATQAANEPTGSINMYGSINHCLKNNIRFSTSYGVWGGFDKEELTPPPSSDFADAHRVRHTTKVICK